MINKQTSRLTTAVAISSVILTGCFGTSAEEYLSAAKEDLGRKDNAAAIIQLKNALQKNPSSPEARFLLGKTLLELGDPRGAAIEFSKAKDLGFKDDRLSSATARTMLTLGQYDKVTAEFQDVRLASVPEMADLKASLASAFSAIGKPVKARDLAEAAVAADPSNIRAQLLRVRLLASSAGLKEAATILEGVIAKIPNSSEAWELKGELLSGLGKSDDAIAAYRQALALRSTNVYAHVGVFNLLVAKKDLAGAERQIDDLRATKADPAQVQMLRTMLALTRNELGKAHDGAQVLLKNFPDDPRILNLAGVVEYRRGSLLEAENFLNKAVQANPRLVSARILLAQVNLRAGDPAKALSTLQPLLGEDETNVDALSLAADAYLQLGEPKRAEESFLKISKLDPKDISSRAALAVAQIARGHADEGMASLRSLSASDPGSVADMALITTLIQKKDWDQALKAIGILTAKLPDKPAPLILRGQIELTRGHKDAAREAFEEANKIDPLYFPAVASLASMDQEAEHTDAAMERYKNFLTKVPNNVSAQMAVIGLRASAGAGKDELVDSLTKLSKQMPGEIRPRLALADLQLKRREIKLALTTAQEATVAAPDNADAWQMLAKVQAISGDLNQAVSSYNKLISLRPKSPEPHVLLAQLYMSRGDKVNASQSIKRALNLSSNNPKSQIVLISAEISAGNFTDARKLADSMRTQYPKEPLVYSLSGDVDAIQKNWGSAIANYRAALKLSPNADVAIKLHRVLQASGKADEAKKFELEWVASNPRQLVFMTYLADAYLMRNDFVSAEQRYRALLKIQPDDASASNNLAWLLNRVKDPAALEYAEKANKLEPEKPAYMDTLAQIQADTGNFAKAVDVQKRAVSLAPDLGMYRFHLAQYLVGAGQKAQAREELVRLTALGDKFTQQTEVKKMLNAL